MKIFREWLFIAIATLLLLVPLTFVHAENTQTTGSAVYVVPVKQTIESGLYSFMERAFQLAEREGAGYIILDMNTLGGRVDSAEEIGLLIRNSAVPTVVFVNGNAASAGSYIALNASKIVMAPGSSIGAAAVVDGSGNEIEDPKIVSHWTGAMRSAAELRGRNPEIAEGMANKNIEVALPELGRISPKGQIISLTAEEALKVGYADYNAADIAGVAEYIGMKDAPIVHVEPTPAEKLARWLTHPVAMTLLLLVGMAGIAIELFVPGFGVPGLLGIAGFGLYFFGHYVAGFAGVESVVFFILGILLLVIEVFVPSFGILGILGIVSIISGVVMAAYDTGNALLSLSVAFVLATIVVAVFIKYFKHRGIWNKFILRESLTGEQGFNSHDSKEHLHGQQGTALTPLRPSGTAMIGGMRVDVVTEGEFIDARRPVQVMHVEGPRIVVKEIHNEQ